MKHLILSSKWQIAAIIALILGVSVSGLFGVSLGVLGAVMAIIWLLIVPGWLIARIISLKVGSHAEYIAYIVGVSLLTCMIVGVLLNGILPVMGNLQPLTSPNITLATLLAWSSLTLVALRRKKLQIQTIKIAINKRFTTGMVVIMIGLFIVALMALGAISLNNGGTNVITLTGLVLSIMYLATIIVLRNRLKESSILWAIYLVGLSLLLMTSLRGWFTTGHDVQREYLVFSATLSSLRWDPNFLRDAYNACISLTVLPTVIKQLSGIDQVYIYKVVYQAWFAIVPVMVYLLARRFYNRLVAILAAVYFIAFPTFFGDMPMLNRQETAFIFIALIFLTMFNGGWSLLRRRIMVSALGAGVILSHYSTNYTMLALFSTLIGLQVVDKVWHIFKRNINKKRQTSTKKIGPGPSSISVVTVGALAIMSFVWSAQLTNTGDNLPRVLASTLTSIQNGLKGDTKSGDTSYSIFAPNKLTDQQRLDNYLETAVATARSEYAPDKFLPASSYANYPPKVARETNLAFTPLGSWLNDHGFPVTQFNRQLRQGSAKFFQVMVLLGIALIFLVKKLRSPVPRDFRLLLVSSMVLLVAIIVLPVLSAEYGLLRAFQQILILCGTAVAVASIWVIPKRFPRLKVVLPSVLALSFLASSTGVFTTLLGGYPPQLHLANGGKYYDLYYVHETDLAAQDWLSNVIDTPDGNRTIQTLTSIDRLGQGLGEKANKLDLIHDISPSLILKESYVVTGYTTNNRGIANVYHNGDMLIYTYPTKFLEDTKDVLYSNDNAKIYQ